MGDFKKNPKKPFEVEVPRKIWRRVAMHHEEAVAGLSVLKTLKSLKPRLLPLIVAPRKRGSMWSRLMNLWRI